MKKSATPTTEQFNAYEGMFAYFNAQLFDGQLPPCLLNFSRKTRTLGFFAPKRWERDQDVRHEISLNPAYLKSRGAEEVASTLVHEMVHLWQEEFGTPSRTGYHNREWAKKMLAVGLTPSTTAAPGGAQTGQRVSHYTTPGGAFAAAFKAMPKELLLPWACEEPTKRALGIALAKNKIKYTCPGCDCNVWGKPDLIIDCGECRERFEAA